MKTFLRVVCPVSGESVTYMLSYYSPGVTKTERWCESCGNTHDFSVSLVSKLTNTRSSRKDGLIWKSGEYQTFVEKLVKQ